MSQQSKSTTRRTRFGIDFGCTYNVEAVADVPITRVLQYKKQMSRLRSILRKRKRHGTDYEILVGFQTWPLTPHDTVFAIKRLSGATQAGNEVQARRNHSFNT